MVNCSWLLIIKDPFIFMSLNLADFTRYLIIVNPTCSGTEDNWWWSWKGQRVSCRYDCTLSGKVENIGSCRKCRRSSFECCREKTYAGLQWKACSFASAAWILLGKFISSSIYLFRVNQLFDDVVLLRLNLPPWICSGRKLLGDWHRYAQI